MSKDTEKGPSLVRMPDLIESRLDIVRELILAGKAQYEIANILKVSVGTISSDCEYLRSQGLLKPPPSKHEGIDFNDPELLEKIESIYDRLSPHLVDLPFVMTYSDSLELLASVIKEYQDDDRLNHYLMPNDHYYSPPQLSDIRHFTLRWNKLDEAGKQAAIQLSKDQQRMYKRLQAGQQLKGETISPLVSKAEVSDAW